MLKAILVVLALFALSANAQESPNCIPDLTLENISGTWTGERVSVLLGNTTGDNLPSFTCTSEMSDECQQELEDTQQQVTFNINAENEEFAYNLVLDTSEDLFASCNEDEIYPFGTYNSTLTGVAFEENELTYDAPEDSNITEPYCMQWCVYVDEDVNAVKATIIQIVNYEGESAALIDEIPFECPAADESVEDCNIEWGPITEPVIVIYNDTFTLECSEGECLNLLESEPSTDGSVISPETSIPEVIDDEEEVIPSEPPQEVPEVSVPAEEIDDDTEDEIASVPATDEPEGVPSVIDSAFNETDDSDASVPGLTDEEGDGEDLDDIEEGETADGVDENHSSAISDILFSTHGKLFYLYSIFIAIISVGVVML